MEKEYISYEQALALKELGFDEPCRDHWEKGTDGHGWGLFTSGDWLTYKDLTPEYKDKEGNLCGEFSCPSFSQAFRWFREKYGLCVWITSKTVDSKTVYIIHGRTIPDIIKNNLIVDIIPYVTLRTYEEAELECLKKLIEIVKNKK